jgi:hypothetical protein
MKKQIQKMRILLILLNTHNIILLYDIIMNNFQNFNLHPKLIVLLASFIFFSIIYMFLDDSHFSGVNFIKDTIKKEVIKKKINNELQDTVNDPMEAFGNSFSNQYQKHVDKAKTDIAMEDVAKNISKDVEIAEIKEDKINVPPFQMFFDRAYFSMNTSCLLGYGDIFPVSNIAKLISMMQSFITVAIIVF